MNVNKAQYSTLFPPRPTEKKVVQMIYDQNERMAGSMPVFRPAEFTAKIADSSSLSREAEAPEAIILSMAGGTVETPSEEEGRPTFGFADFLDIINPLQHIPLVSSVYQHITDDKIGLAANILGGALFGGPLGVVGGIATTVASAAFSGKAKVGVIPNIVYNDTTIALANLREGLTPYNS